MSGQEDRLSKEEHKRIFRELVLPNAELDSSSSRSERLRFRSIAIMLPRKRAAKSNCGSCTFNVTVRSSRGWGNPHPSRIFHNGKLQPALVRVKQLAP